MRRSSTFTVGEDKVSGIMMGGGGADGVGLRVGTGADVGMDVRGRRSSSDSVGCAAVLGAVVWA